MSNYYFIKSKLSGNVIDIVGASTKPCVDWDYSSRESQQQPWPAPGEPERHIHPDLPNRGRRGRDRQEGNRPAHHRSPKTLGP
jgi:hypothetical protein